MKHILQQSLVMGLCALFMGCSTNVTHAKNKTIETVAQNLTCDKVDKKIARALKQSFETSGYNYANNSTTDYDKTETANQSVASILTTYTQQADSMACQFTHSVKEGLLFATSDDKRFRAYTWDENTGGTMHFYSALVQYIDDDGNSHGLYEASWLNEDEESTNQVAGRLYDLATIHAAKQTYGSPIYVLASHAIGSNIDRAITIKLFQINNDSLNNPNLIKTRTRYTDEISFSYDASSLYVNKINRQLFEFNSSDNSFSFPVVLASDKFYSGEVTKKRIVYRFDGQYFKRVKN